MSAWLEVVDQAAVLAQVEVVDAEELLGPLDPALGRRDRLVLLVEFVVVVGPEVSFDSPSELQPVFGGDAVHLAGEAGELVVDLRRLFGRAGDDQRRARLVDQDVVDLVDDREAVAALHAVLQRVGHVVAQVVEAELGVGAVDDVAGVFDLPRLVVVGVLDRGDADPERVVDRLHPLGVAAGQVVVDGDEVDAVAGRAC